MIKTQILNFFTENNRESNRIYDLTKLIVVRCWDVSCSECEFGRVA